MRAPSFHLFLLILLVTQTCGARQLAVGQAPAASPSIIDIPVRLSLAPLISAAEKTLPHQAGNWRSWRDWHGVKSRYRAWRGPLGVTINGDVLTVQAHIRYWIQARKKVLGAVNLKGSCGVDEPPRQALIGMQVRLGWGPDWTLRPRFRLLPTRFIDRCEMTIADIDVTPLVEKEFRKQMQKSLRAALVKLAPGMQVIRQQAGRSWSLLQEPIVLGNDRYLLLRPTGIALGPVSGRGKHIDTRLAVSLQPAMVKGTATVRKPLPPLERYIPRSPGLNLRLAVALDFADLNRQLTRAVAGRAFDVNGRKAGIEEVELSGKGDTLRARLALTGELAGAAELETRLAYDAGARRLAMRDLEFDYAPDDFALDFLAKAMHEQIRQGVEDAANRALAAQLELLTERLGATLQKIAPEGVTLDMAGLQLSGVQIDIQPQGLRLDATASGAARLLLR